MKSQQCLLKAARNACTSSASALPAETAQSIWRLTTPVQQRRLHKPAQSANTASCTKRCTVFTATADGESWAEHCLLKVCTECLHRLCKHRFYLQALSNVTTDVAYRQQLIAQVHAKGLHRLCEHSLLQAQAPADNRATFSFEHIALP